MRINASHLLKALLDPLNSINVLDIYEIIYSIHEEEKTNLENHEYEEGLDIG